MQSPLSQLDEGNGAETPTYYILVVRSGVWKSDFEAIFGHFVNYVIAYSVMPVESSRSR